MILSASRRTDIPAFYSEWFLNRLKEKYVLVPSPYRPNIFRFIALRPEIIDCIVFWSKNPAPLLPKLPTITSMGYSFYFQFTLTPYGSLLERNFPSKEMLFETFFKLCEHIGPERIIWRYDPIVFTDIYDVDYHVYQFEKFANKLKGYTKKCVVSFLDRYPKIEENMQNVHLAKPSENTLFVLMEKLSSISRANEITLATCSEKYDFSKFSVSHASCIDKTIIEQMIHCPIITKKDSNQRKQCQCIESIDIGVYDTCFHQCSYCYAGFINKKEVLDKFDDLSPSLAGAMPNFANIQEINMESIKDPQARFF